ncbi:hypothetical protein [Sorangium sp. So ce1389]|uniref:hypothetical protein n=1 Tax=Sorangium sp. So ce1389 TaxID=3133336 RepID=UPI003F5E86AE
MSTLFSPSEDPSRAPVWNSVHAAALAVLAGALRLLGVAEPDIDDLSQDVLLAAYERLDRFDSAYPASAGHPPPHETVSAGAPPQRGGRRQHGSAEARERLRTVLGARLAPPAQSASGSEPSR